MEKIKQRFISLVFFFSLFSTPCFAITSEFKDVFQYGPSTLEFNSLQNNIFERDTYNGIGAKTFKLESAWMKRFFNPIAGSDEKVIIPLKKERNKIKLSAYTTKVKGATRKGNDEHHSYKDTDVFEIRIDKK